jgi:hypothetical protein
MPNKSEIGKPGSWEKWRAAGALAKHPEQVEREERQAETWIREKYRLNPSQLESKEYQRFRQGEDERNALDVGLDYGGHSNGNLALIREHPVLTYEEYQQDNGQDFGTTNNFWNRFFPEANKDDDLVIFWTEKGWLLPAFQELGWLKARKLHEDIADFLALDAEFKQRLGDDPHELWYGLYGINHHPRADELPSSRVKKYLQADFDFTNTLRELAINLVDKGVAFRSIHR